MKRWIYILTAMLALASAGSVYAVTGRSPATWFAAHTDARAPEAKYNQTDALPIMTDWARDYVAQTIGTEVQVNGRPLSLDEMTLVNVRFVPTISQLVVSISSAAQFADTEDVWVASWELGGIDNVTTGQADGTAYVDVVLRDGTADVLSASAGVRQPDVQALAREPLPSFDSVSSLLTHNVAR